MPAGSQLLAWVLVAAAPADDPFTEIRALDSAAGFELDAIRSRCGDPAQTDAEAAAAADRAASIHRTRISLARQRAGASAEDVVPLALQAVDAHERAYACERGRIAHLVEAHALLVGLQAELTDPASAVAQTLARRIDALAAVIGVWKAQQPPEAPARPEVRIVALEADVKPGPRDTLLGRLALRLEVGASFVRAGAPPTYFFQRGPAFRAAFLARFAVSERARLHLLFGPYYGFARVTDSRGIGSGMDWWQGDTAMHRVGAQFEAQWVPARQLERWLSVHPALEFGLEQHTYIGRSVTAATGFQVGGGLSLCVWRHVFCPGARAVATPVVDGTAVVQVQAGLAIDVMRLADVAVSRQARGSARPSAAR
jgi:hypothetical protein